MIAWTRRTRQGANAGAREERENVRTIDANRLFAVVKGHHDLYKDATSPADKARRDENLQMMCDITGAPTVDAILVEWMEAQRDKEKRGTLVWWLYQAIINKWREEQDAKP